MFGRFRRSDEVVGFALSGGGSRGAVQIGAIRALQEAGIHPQVLAGTSAGAVNAAFLALYPDGLDRLESIWLTLRQQDVFPGGRLRIMYNLIRHGYVHAADRWYAFLQRYVGSAHFEDAALPCAVVAVRLRDGKRVVFDRGPILPALMASTAIPGGFPPYRIGDEFYVDGGVLEYMPIQTVLELGATTVYGLDCSWFDIEGSKTDALVDRCARISSAASVELLVSLPNIRGKKIHRIRPEADLITDSRNFSQTRALIAAGYEAASTFVAAETGRVTRSPGDSPVADGRPEVIA